MKPLEVRDGFRKALDETMRQLVGERYAAINLGEVKDPTGEQNLKRFYRNIRYSYEIPTRLANVPETSKWISRVKDRISRIKIGQKEKSDEKRFADKKEVEAYSYVSNNEDKYMAANWPENNFLNDLVKVYAPDYIITINQFEIKTDYRKCVDRELGNLTRRIRVHFNVFNPKGECIFGDVVTATYNSTSEDIENIIGDNFDLLGEFISSPIAMPLSSN